MLSEKSCVRYGCICGSMNAARFLLFFLKFILKHSSLPALYMFAATPWCTCTGLDAIPAQRVINTSNSHRISLVSMSFSKYLCPEEPLWSMLYVLSMQKMHTKKRVNNREEHILLWISDWGQVVSVRTFL